MTKTLLFLYPYKQYIDALEEYAKEFYDYFNLSSSDVETCLNGINVELDYYKKEGFQFYFVMYSNGLKINTELISPRIKIQAQDKIIPAGIPFLKGKNYVYADSEFILNQIEQPIEELVIGGFHNKDCCARIFDAAILKKIPAKIDEKITENFYLDKHIMKYFEQAGGLAPEEAGFVYV